MNDKLPKVLVVSITVWRDDSPIRTLPELFSCWDRERIAQIYTRAGLPDNSVCDRYFRIDENAVLKSVFKPRTVTGEAVENQKNGAGISAAEQVSLDAENSRYAAAHRRHSWLMTLCREAVWWLGRWKSEELDRFVQEFDPDVIFVPIYPYFYMERIQTYLIKKFKKPVVCFIADDNYTYFPCGYNPLAYLHRFILRRFVCREMPLCDSVFVMTPMAKREYDRIFSVDSKLLTKAIDFDGIEYAEPALHTPIKMVYTGKLVIGRDKALTEIAKALKDINKSCVRIQLDIYAPDMPSDRIIKALDVPGCRLCGAVTKDKVAQLQSEADILVFAESLSYKYRNAARLSFSTKITDYFSSGRCVLAIGSRNIAPIDYLIQEDAAIVVTDYKDIKLTLESLCDNPEIITEYSKKAFDCGKRNHSKSDVYQLFKKTISDTAYKKAE
ncbi:MAG: hypothetical protein IJ298_01870 [Ruminococcus sp.]|nr:hypothetical protein [Ruminococcus sp.]